MIPLVLFFLLGIVLAIYNLLCSYINFRVGLFFLFLLKSVVENLMKIASNLQTAFGRMAT